MRHPQLLLQHFPHHHQPTNLKEKRTTHVTQPPSPPFSCNNKPTPADLPLHRIYAEKNTARAPLGPQRPNPPSRIAPRRTTTTTMTPPPPSPRPLITGPPSGPTPPYPLRLSGPVIPGFGRGSSSLGIPTANLPVDTPTTPWIETIPSGVYFGWTSLLLPASHPDHRPASATTQFTLFPMVMSIGYNPFFKNATRSAEVHVLHGFKADFYGVPMRLLLLGFIRDELDYAGVEALIADIKVDCEVARNSLARDGWRPREVAEGGRLDCGWLLRGLEEGERKEVVERGGKQEEEGGEEGK